jgi:hypothetical protein
MKEAAVRDLAGDSRYWVERSLRCGLRVDLEYLSKKRKYLVECETRPRIPRLRDKGARRNKISWSNVYVLVVTEKYFWEMDWARLRGYFDVVLAYDPDLDTFTERRDLRFMGVLRDRFLDSVLPVVKSKKVMDTLYRLKIRKNVLKWKVRTVIQCSACHLHIETPWMFCPRHNCPRSTNMYRE